MLTADSIQWIKQSLPFVTLNFTLMLVGFGFICAVKSLMK